MVGNLEAERVVKVARVVLANWVVEHLVDAPRIEGAKVEWYKPEEGHVHVILTRMHPELDAAGNPLPLRPGLIYQNVWTDESGWVHGEGPPEEYFHVYLDDDYQVVLAVLGPHQSPRSEPGS